MREEVAQRGSRGQRDLERVGCDLGGLRALEEEVHLREEPLKERAVSEAGALLPLVDPLRRVLRDAAGQWVAASDLVADAVHCLLEPNATEVIRVPQARPTLLLARCDAAHANARGQRLALQPERVSVAALHLDWREVGGERDCEGSERVSLCVEA